MQLFTWVILGLAMGVLGRAVMQGRGHGGYLGRALVGAVGAVLGGFIGRVVGLAHEPGPVLQPGIVLALAGAVLVLLVYEASDEGEVA